MSINNLVEEPSSVTLRWMIYSSINENDSWDSEVSDGYQIVSEALYSEFTAAMAGGALQGACVQAIESTSTGNPAICHFVNGAEATVNSLSSNEWGKMGAGTPIQGARNAPVKLAKFAQDVQQAKENAETAARWAAWNAA